MGFREKYILAVDDDPDLLDIYVDLLSSANVHVHTAGNGLEGLEKIEKQRYDAIITDIKMPRLHGLQLVSCVKVSKYNNRTPVFVISSELFGENLKKLQLIGAVEKLDKPLDYDQLKRKMARVLDPNMRQAVGYNPEYVDLIVDSIRQVVSQTFSAPGKIGKPFIHRGYEPFGVATGVVSLYGKQVYGMMSVSCDDAMIKIFAARLFGEDTTKSSKLDFKDIVGEFANQMATSLHSSLDRRQLHVVVGIPFVLKGITGYRLEFQILKLLWK